MILSPLRGTSLAALARIRPMLPESNMPTSQRAQNTGTGRRLPRPPKTPEALARMLSGLRQPWPKGRSGNPGGRPKKEIEKAARRMATWRITPALAARLEIDLLGMRVSWSRFVGLTVAEAIALSQIREAVAGETRAAEFLADRIDGPLVRKLDVTSEGKKLAESGQLSPKLIALLAKAKPEGKS